MEHNGVAVGDGLINKSVDFISLVYIAFLIVLLIIRWHIFPVFIDIYYHLAVMQGYNLAGGLLKTPIGNLFHLEGLSSILRFYTF